MKAYVFCRLYADDGCDDGRDLSLIRGDSAYTMAKVAARRGDLKPLIKILSKLMNDPGIADFIAVPRQGRGRRSNPFEVYARRVCHRHGAQHS